MEGLRALVASSYFASPQYFWAASALMLAAIFVPLARRRRGLAFDSSFWRRRVDLRSRQKLWLGIPVALVSLLMGAIFADPQRAGRETGALWGKPVLVVFDVSGSMDFKAGSTELSNVEKGRQALSLLFDMGTGADFGLLLFGNQDFMSRYFAPNKDLLADTLENKQDFVMTSGTEIPDALRRARLFLDSTVEGGDKALLLISDLEQDDDAATRMATEMRSALQAGVKVYVLVTTDDMKKTLAKIPPEARVSGVTLVAVGDRQGLQRIAGEIEGMQSSALSQNKTTRHTLIPYLVPPILGLIGLGLVLSETRFRKLP